VEGTRARRLLLVGTVVLLVIRLVLVLFRTGPLVVADEAGYLMNARALTGGVRGQLEAAPFYRGGYSLLIAPLVAIFSDPVTAYRLILVLNVVLAAAVAPLLYLLLTHHFRTPPHAAVWPALAAAAYPSVTLFSQVALSENLLVPLAVVWLLCFGGLLEASRARGRAWWGLALGAATIALFAVHGRMIVAVALTVGALALLVARRRLPALPAFLSVAVIAAGYVGVRFLNDFLISRNYGGHQPDEVGERLSSLGDVDGVLSVARNLVGQTWYVMVATLGVVVAFAIGGGLRGLPSIRRRDVITSEFLLALLLATGGGLLVLSALSFRDVERPDMFIYGRYAEVVVPPLLALALARLGAMGRYPSLRAVTLTLAGASVAVDALRAGLNPPRGSNRWNVASLPFPTFGLGITTLVGAAIVAVAATLTGAALVRRAPALLAPAVLVAFLPTTAIVERNPAFSGERDVYRNGWTSPAVAATDTRVVAYDMDQYDIFGLYAYQWFTPHSRFVLFSGSAGAPPARYVISSHEWGRRHQQLRARELWADPNRDQALFRVTRMR
jgi:hypothetical protein